MYGGPPSSAALYSRIVWFHRYTHTQGDVDNIIKKIHDSLKDVLFIDDRVVTHTMAVRVDSRDGVEISPDPNSPEDAETLLASINDPSIRDILYIEVGLQIDRKIYLGPIA